MLKALNKLKYIDSSNVIINIYQNKQTMNLKGESGHFSNLTSKSS